MGVAFIKTNKAESFEAVKPDDKKVASYLAIPKDPPPKK